MTITDVFKQSTLPRLETELLLASLLKKSREHVLTHPEKEISLVVFRKYKTLEKKHQAGYSVATLIGEKEFFGLNFFINKHVLVPRPETELIVNETLNIIKEKNKPFSIIDLGTGSGAIIVSLAKQLNILHPELFIKSNFKAVDISSRALKVAKENIIKFKLKDRIEIISSNLLKNILNKPLTEVLRKDIIITANLPYLTKKQIKNSFSIKKEPRLALLAGSDGLKYYRRLFKQINILADKLINKQDNFSISILCEIDPSQVNSIKSLINEKLGKVQVNIKKDLKDNWRLIIINLNYQKLSEII